MSLLPQLTDLFRAQLGQPDLVLTPDTTAADVDGWDSIMHIQLMMAIEAEFGISFNTDELVAYPTVGALAQAIAQKAGLQA